MLKKDWPKDVNHSLDSIVEESQKVLASCQKEIELYEIGKKQKDDEKRALTSKLDKAGASIKTSRTNIEQYLTELNKNSESKLVVIFAYNSIFNLLLKTNNYLFQN